MKAIATSVAVFTLSLFPVAVRAQNSAESAPAPAQHYYRLHFAVQELNAAGKVTNTRSYEETIATANGADQQIKTGSRVPIVTGTYGSNGSTPASANTQFQYIDLGVNLDVRDATEHGDKLGFRLKAEISSIARQTEIAGMGEPVIRQNTWDSHVTVPVGKPTVVFSSDDLDSTGKVQVEVMATSIE